MLTIQRETEKRGGAYVQGIFVDGVRVAKIVKWGRHKWSVQDYEYTSSGPHWLDAVAYTSGSDVGEVKAYGTLAEASDAVRHAYAARMPTRYTELTDTQKAHVDAYINALASGGQTAITHAVKGWVRDARAAITHLEAHAQNTAAPLITGCREVRHALAMIVDATVLTDVDR